MLNNKPAPADRVKAAVESLLSFWNTGRSSWAAVQATVAVDETGTEKKREKNKRKAYVHGRKLDVLHTQAAERGISYDTLAKAWKASREYSAAQIEKLCDLVTKYRARFGATHLTRLLAVKDRKTRDVMTRTAIRGRWGVTALERAIQSVNGRREHVGKRPTIPDGQPELLNSLVALCDKWERFCAGAVVTLSSEVKAAVDRATKAVLKVKNAAIDELIPSAANK